MNDEEKRVGNGVSLLLDGDPRRPIFDCKIEILDVAYSLDEDESFLYATRDALFRLLPSGELTGVRLSEILLDDEIEDVKLSSIGMAAIQTRNRRVCFVDLTKNTHFFGPIAPNSKRVLFALVGRSLAIVEGTSSVLVCGEYNRRRVIGDEIECLAGSSTWILIVTKNVVMVLSRRLEILLALHKPHDTRVSICAISESAIVMVSKTHTWVYSFTSLVWTTLVVPVQVTSLSVSSDMIAIGNVDGTIQCYDSSDTLKLRASQKIHSGGIRKLYLSSDSRSVVSCSDTFIAIMATQGTFEGLGRIIVDNDETKVTDLARSQVLQWLTGTTSEPPINVDKVVKLYVMCFALVKKKYGGWREKDRLFIRHISARYDDVAKAKHHGAMMFFIQSLELYLLSFYSLLEAE